MQTTQQSNNEYRSIPLTMLQESATNPRRRFDEEHLKELAASFKSQGVLAPLLVRELTRASTRSWPEPDASEQRKSQSLRPSRCESFN